MTSWLSRLRRWRQPSSFAEMDAAPLSSEWGFDRGTPIDRYYIERFLESHSADIRGRALEVKNADYISRFGRGVTRSDVLDINRDNPLATLVADLSQPEQFPERAPRRSPRGPQADHPPAAGLRRTAHGRASDQVSER